MTKIQWTDETWNPTRGCSRTSPGCLNCYAERMAHRFSGPGQPYEGLTTIRNGRPRWTGEVRFVPKMLEVPLRWSKPRMVFVDSMSDLFHPAVTNEQIAAVFGVMSACPQHTFQVITKRAWRMREWFEWVDKQRRRNDMPQRTPPTNVWLGTSVESQAAAEERITELLWTPASVRFVSAEPLLERVEFRYAWLTGEDVDATFSPRLDWVIVGGESGPGARPCNVDWIRSIVRQCQAAGVACFVKQLGSNPMMRHDSLEGRRNGDHPEREWPEGTRFGTTPGDERTERQGHRVFLRDQNGADMSEWPSDLRVREWPEVVR